MQGEWTPKAQNALEKAREASIQAGHPYVGTEHLLQGLMALEDSLAGKALKEAGARPEKLAEMIQKLITPSSGAEADTFVLERGLPNTDNSPRMTRVLEDALRDAKSRGDAKAGTGHLLLAMLREKEGMGTRLLHTMGVNVPKLYGQVLSAMGLDESTASRELSQGQTQSGATPVLDKYSRDLTALAAQGLLDPVIGREQETARVIQILSRRTKNNPCLVGEPGVGKTAIVEGLAQQIAQGKAPKSMASKRVVILDMAGMVAGTKYRGEFEERIRNVIDEVRDHPGVLLFIDELHTIIGAGGAEGTLDAANILKPALSRGEIQIIGATTLEEYRKYVEKDAALERRFQPVTVQEPTPEETLKILEGVRHLYEDHHGVTITQEALEAAVFLSQRYVNDRRLPDKAIDLMDEACAKVQLSGFARLPELEDLSRKTKQMTLQVEEAIRAGDLEKARHLRESQKKLQKQLEEEKEQKETNGTGIYQVDEETVAGVVSDWTRIPLAKLTEKESQRLARLEEELHKRIIGQEEAVHALAQAVKRGRVGLKDPKRPIGSFLFLGPTGVGKTELSKALAEAVFGSEQNMIRVDMSEYMEKHSVSKLIGSPPGYVGFEDGGQLSEKVRQNPYSVLLFDEIEKAHPDVFNILLQVLDDGRITDAHGRKVDFRQTIIIMTSNAGAQSIVEPKKLGFVSAPDAQKDYERMKSGVMEEVRRIFRPEFLNRIDEIMVFRMLSREEIGQIVNLLTEELRRRCRSQMEIDLDVTPLVREEIAKAGFDPKYGARPLKRQIQTKIEDALANEILEGKISRGDTVRIRAEEGNLFFEKLSPQEAKAQNVQKKDQGAGEKIAEE